VRATRVNHVSIHAVDLEASARFYEELFGLERVPTPRFQEEVIWFRVGDQQLHLFRSAERAPRAHHYGFDVDDFETAYRRAKELGLLDGETFHQAVRTHPAGWVQMYLRDPAGNLVEIDWPDVSALNPDLVAELGRLDDEVPQVGEAREATLYTGTRG